MSFAEAFTDKFSSSIISVLGCFDRVIFKGHLPFGDESHLNSFVDAGLRMRRKDFLPWLEGHSQLLVDHGKQLAEKYHRPYEYRQGKVDKEKLTKGIIRCDALEMGLVAVLYVQETRRTVKLRYGKKKPRLAFARRP